ncbi:hypothetical protein Ct61P_10260 [Colletotrichum tofieldiae]|nr:hypothetical protein Ct61P_10260 [Colletotrichum tofieldiae]
MDTQDTSSIGTGASTNPSHRKQHKPSSSLGSLYEVLADLDDTQLQYLIQEMNHTGHRNVPVSQAVSALEAQTPTDFLGFEGSNPSAPRQEPQRRLSKSQRGKLRLQTAFRRAPSLQQGRPGRPGSRDARDANVDGGPRRTCSASTAPVDQNRPSTKEKHHGLLDNNNNNNNNNGRSPIFSGNIDFQRNQSHKQLPIEKTADAGAVRLATDGNKRESPAYRRIPRPDFSLPAGVTVVDLLQLLEFCVFPVILLIPISNASIAYRVQTLDPNTKLAGVTAAAKTHFKIGHGI